MDISLMIKTACTYARKSEAQLARDLGTTPSAFNQRLKTGKFSGEDLDAIAAALGAEFICCFRFPDGKQI